MDSNHPQKLHLKHRREGPPRIFKGLWGEIPTLPADYSYTRVPGLQSPVKHSQSSNFRKPVHLTRLVVLVGLKIRHRTNSRSSPFFLSRSVEKDYEHCYDIDFAFHGDCAYSHPCPSVVTNCCFLGKDRVESLINRRYHTNSTTTIQAVGNPFRNCEEGYEGKGKIFSHERPQTSRSTFSQPPLLPQNVWTSCLPWPHVKKSAAVQDHYTFRQSMFPTTS